MKLLITLILVAIGIFFVASFVNGKLEKKANQITAQKEATLPDVKPSQKDYSKAAIYK